MAKELARKLINAGVHFGHGVSRWNPKMAPFIFAKRGNIHIIDVKSTLKGLLIAKKLIVEVVSSGKDVVFVGTKRQAQKAVEAAAERCGMHYVSQRWLGGMLTNFRTIRSRLQRLEQLEAMAEDGTLDSESKKQASRLKREMRKIRANLQGVRNMSRLPGAVIVVDAKKEYLALREAEKLEIATIGLLDTDSDPDTVDVAIPANDDSIRAIDLILNEMADAVAIGKTMVTARQEQQPQRPRRFRPPRRPAMARTRAEKPQPVTAVDTGPKTEPVPAPTPATEAASPETQTEREAE
ncbi:MAG: 30S ribosomal protein S2 [Phycisphaerales bacterium]|nr:MAG: 30S ribosomal protein S2 [Phycisphaerales bacterium]UCF17869.1 MAG: 30S ribosomal protein S2 [Phycisphaerales bacterium]